LAVVRLRILVAIIADSRLEVPKHVVHESDPEHADANHTVHGPYNAINDYADVSGVHGHHSW
jgi:hypothetical protein